MFSGITETMGYIKQISSHAGCKDFHIVPHQPFTDLHQGDSVAVNGTCLTITDYDEETFSVTAVPETLSRTNLSFLQENQVVNLERAMRLDQRLGGHFVQGHVDDMGTISRIQKQEGALYVTIQAPQTITTYTVPKGFIAIDGMSITLIDTTPEYFTVTFIPHTIQHTIVQYYAMGTRVNLEVDILAKTIKKLLENYV